MIPLDFSANVKRNCCASFLTQLHNDYQYLECNFTLLNGMIISCWAGQYQSQTSTTLCTKQTIFFPFFSENYKFLTTMISFSLFSCLGEITQPTTPRRRSRLRVRADWNRHSRFLKSFSGNLFTNVMFCLFAIPNKTNSFANSSTLQSFTEFSCLQC